MLTQKSTKSDIQKVALRIIMKQHERFTEQEIVECVLNQFVDGVEVEMVERIVAKTIEYCWREIHLTEIIDGEYVIKPDRKELVNAFLNHEGVTV